MSWVVTAVVGGSLASSLIGANAAQNAADTQANAANNATQAQVSMYNQNRTDLAPYRQAGYTALNTLTSGTSDGGQFTHPFGPADLTTNLSPNYQFMLGQGLGATTNLLNRSGGLLSGNTLKGINDYAQNYASNAYQQAFENYTANQTNIFNRLSDIAGLGQTANQTAASLAGSMAPGISNTITGMGQAQASGTVSVANALTGGINNAASWYYGNNLMNRMLPAPSGGTSLGAIPSAPDLGAGTIYGTS